MVDILLIMLLLDHQGQTIHVSFETSAGLVEILCDYRLTGKDLILEGAHIQGLFPGALGRAGLNALAQKIMEGADVDTLEIHGGLRTTGRNGGRFPRLIRARHRIGP